MLSYKHSTLIGEIWVWAMVWVKCNIGNQCRMLSYKHSTLIFRKWCFQSIAPGWIFSNIAIHQLWYIFQYTIVTKNEIIPSQKNVVLDGCRYAFIGIYGIVLTWRIFWDHKNNLLKKIFNIPLLIISKNFTN